MRRIHILLSILLLLPSIASADHIGNRLWRHVCTCETLFGTWGGVRTKLEDKGISFEFLYTGEVMGNLSGGISRGAKYLDNFDLTTTWDLEKLVGWKGASLFVYGLGNQGGSPSALTGDAQGVSNIDAPDTWKLYQAVLEQNLFDGKLSLMAGLHDLNSEFDTIETASLFPNGSHGMGPDFSQTGQNGPPTFPNTSLGFRVRVRPLPELYIQSAVYDGVPGDPANPTSPFAVSLSAADGALITTEIGVTPGDTEKGDPRRKYAFGTWAYTSQFADLTEVDGAGVPVNRRGNFGFYALGDYQVYQEQGEGDQGLALYLRTGYANPSFNQFVAYVGTGAVYTGLFPTRDEDKLGVSIATAITGSKFKQAMAAAGTPAKNAEVNIELTYRAQITPWLALQPDIQFIVNPGTVVGVSHAIALGARMEIVF